MAERSVVTESPELLDALCTVLRRHGVVRYERASDGSVKLEMLAAMPAVAHPVTITDDTPADAAPRLAALPRTDPLFDGVEGV